jgi:micrococcal nuclease
MIFSLIFIFLITSVLNGDDLIKARSVRVIDGDTLVVKGPDENPVTIRLYGMDTPERGEPFFKEAKDALSKHVLNKNLKYTVLDTDRFGRSVALIYESSDVSINHKLVKQGFARVHDRYCKRDICKIWYKSQEKVQKEKKRIWRSSIIKDNNNKISYVEGKALHGNVKSRIAHYPWCRHYNCENCTRIFKNLEAVKKAGYRMDKTCSKRLH